MGKRATRLLGAVGVLLLAGLFVALPHLFSRANYSASGGVVSTTPSPRVVASVPRTVLGTSVRPAGESVAGIRKTRETSRTDGPEPAHLHAIVPDRYGWNDPRFTDAHGHTTVPAPVARTVFLASRASRAPPILS